MTVTGGWGEGRGWGWDEDEEYGKVFYERATGGLPEMESSQAVAKLLAQRIGEGEVLLDVGCGAGHYLRSLRRLLPARFEYIGVDGAPLYARLGSEAFAADGAARFLAGNAFALPLADGAVDVAMCNNVFLHLPSIAQPLRELCRVARRAVVVRTLVGERSFRIQEVRGAGDEFDDDATPRAFNWYNIYSAAYVDHLARSIDGVRDVRITADRDFDPERINASAAALPGSSNVTTMYGEWQINGYVLQPWSFVEIELG